MIRVVGLALVFCAASLAGTPETVRIAAERVEVRREAKADAQVLGTATKGTVLEVLGRDGGWVRLAYPIGNGAFYIGFVPGVLCEDAHGAAPSAAQPSPPLASLGAGAEVAAPPPLSEPEAAPVVSSPTGPTAVYVGPDTSGRFVETSKEILDSVKDLKEALRDDLALRLVSTETAALVRLYVAGRDRTGIRDNSSRGLPRKLGNAAERLGLNRSTLQFRMKKLGIERPPRD